MDCRRNCSPLHPLLSQKSAWPLSPWLQNLCTVARCEQKEGESACWQDQGNCVTVVDPEGGLSPFSPSLPMRGEREGGDSMLHLCHLVPSPLWDRRGSQVESWCGWLEYQGQEKHVLPLARKPADCTLSSLMPGVDNFCRTAL